MNEVRKIWDSIYAQHAAMLEGLEKVKSHRAELLKLFVDMQEASIHAVAEGEKVTPEFLKEIDYSERKCLAWEAEYYNLLEELK